ncbi:malonic semialdehyde reductase [Aquitalea aquatica]|uniref:Malonic semialdehyde reductase n=1 Tax=Aquitalea aquatica TaxID=3044273 RepID=A0A838YAJ3_9NEIS|nr:malonic semialdehyde reductase [Aquitalea magnusonii]MBA4710412.1 malonic semialdehyde reductase [Aquitalea magnusonii]
MSSPLSAQALDQLFVQARSTHHFQARPVTEDTIRQLYALLKWGPTAFNGQPGRYLFIHSAEARQKLLPTLSSGNRDKTAAAPLTVVLAWDPAFHQHLPEQYPAYDAKGFYDGLPQLIEPHARTNASLQAGYLILAARALGLDAGPMAGFDAAAVDAAFFPDGQWRSLLLVNLGYGVRDGQPPRGPRLDFEQAAAIV